MLTYEDIPQYIPPQLETREYQCRIIANTINDLNAGYKSILIESPTGSGKTPTALMILKILKQQTPSLTINWIAMRRKLLQQAENENKRVGVTDIRFISMFDKRPPKADFIVCDEGHHSAAATMASLYEMVGAKRSLAMTASPFRTDRIKLSFERIISDCGVRFLIEQGYLSPFDSYTIPKYTPQEIAKQLTNNPSHWGKTVVFLHDTNQCNQLQGLLTKGGVSSAIMLGIDGEEKRERDFEAFDDGRIQVLINVYLLSEGFDCVDLKSVFVRDSNKLYTMQTAGRALRKDPNNPDKIAQIVQSSETHWPYQKCVKIRPRKQYLWKEERWQSLEASDLAFKVMRKTRQNIMSNPATLPRFLSDRGQQISSIRITTKGNVKYQNRNYKEIK